MDIKQFDVIYVDFGNNVGHEQSGYRPAVVVQNDLGNRYCPTLVVVPLTTSLKKIGQPTHNILYKDKFNGLLKDSMLLGESLTSISKERIVKKVGHISRSQQQKVLDVYIANVVGRKKDKDNEFLYLLKMISSMIFNGCSQRYESVVY